MFYSQFILAKKGPLGTIWIAAHLERKLRKNQVADTDIGVSVDSILFPDVPIALRLSSHLLLGVVRIYSRKVNYLFDDCSDALLKIKQAFRSTAVDLPPEESTAPYHSITLPETFDLDDFELPDNDGFQGNYDHHISTKEQITLQDTMEGVVYSTSQFGLDERFGDGDTSQIGLDLAEDLFLDKLAAPGHAGVMLNSGADPQTSFQPITPFEEDENNEEMDETSQAMAAVVGGNQDYAEAPSTPGLVEEPNLSNVQKALASDDHLETEDHNSADLEAIENVGTASSKSDHHGYDKHDLQMTPDGMPVEENGYDLGGNKIQHLKPHGDLLTTSENVEHLQNGVPSNNETSVDLRGVGWDGTVSSPSSSHGASKEGNCHKSCSGVEKNLENFRSSSTQLTIAEGIPENDHALLLEISSNVEISKNVEESCTPSNTLTPNSFYPLEHSAPEAVAEDQVRPEPKDCKTLDPDEEMPSTRVHVLQPCNSDLKQSKKLSLGGDCLVALSDLRDEIDGSLLKTSGMEEAILATEVSAEMQGEECHPTAAVKPFLEAIVMSEMNFTEDIEADRSYVDAVSKDTLEFPNSSAVSELPAPEKLLSMPEGPSTLLNDLLVETTPDKMVPVYSEGDGTGITIISGKKRSFTESTLTLQSLNSNELFAKPQSKRTADFIPDDDDLLSSILVGRRSSILKMKPTPTPSEVMPMKRPRTTSRVSASKRKILMDDSMVLHGDTIRQQLTTTEDIRRVRKKAPSTRHEIWIIQKQFLEDELFSDPISTGMSIELIGLHNQTYDLSSIRISLDENITSLDSAKDMDPTVRPNDIKGSTETSVVRIDGEAQLAGILVHTENEQGEDNWLASHENDSQLPLDATSADIDVKTSNHEHGEIAEMEIDGGSVEVADAAECAVAPGAESLCPTGPVSDVFVQMHASCLPRDEKLDFQSVEEDASILDLSNGHGINAVNVGDIHNDFVLEFETESLARGEYSLNGAEVGETFEVRVDSCAGSSRPTDNADPSITTTSPETGGCNDLLVASNDQSMEEIANDDPEFVKEHEIVGTEVGYDDKNPSSNHMSCGEPIADSLYLVECDLKKSYLDGGETVCFNDVKRPSCPEAEAHGIMDLENTLDHHVIEDHGDMDNIMVEHDTEFLNVDDDDIAEEDDSYMPSAEETRFLENSGWSSRSRAVAKYLQTLFDKEAELGKKVIPMDNLLSGKTRKEASRMFFETLVLKTRDYIHVEQQNPFNNINIKPRGKLMKSDF